MQTLTETKVETLRVQLGALRHLHNELALLLNPCRGENAERCPIIAHFEQAEERPNDVEQI